MARTLDLTTLGLAFGEPILTSPGIGLTVEGAPPLPGYVRLTNVSGQLRTLDMCLTGEATVTAGFGGWDTVDRPGRVGVTVWRGGDPLAMDIPVLLDGVDAGRTVDKEWTALQLMARPANGSQPPTLKLAGPVPYTTRQWVLDGVDEDEERTIRDAHGRPRRVAATLHLLQFVEPDVVKPGASEKAVSKGVRRRSIRTKKGDTLRKIAKRELKSARRWPEIRKLNKGLHDPDRVLPTNTKLWLPR